MGLVKRESMVKILNFISTICLLILSAIALVSAVTNPFNIRGFMIPI